MEIKVLIYFVEVYKYRNFSQAAEKLHVTQPTLSKAVKFLETELEVKLFERSTKQVIPTDVGEIVYRQALKILKSVEDLSSELSDVIGLQRGKVKIALPPMIGANFFPKVIAQFYNRYPHITIELFEDGAFNVAQNVENGTLDLGVVLLPIEQTCLNYFPFAVDQLMLAVHPQHPLAAKEQVALKELKDELFIFYRQDFTLHHRIKAECLKLGFEPKIVVESSQWDFIGKMVAANLGIALLPSTICRELDPDKMKFIPLVSPVIPWDLGLIWHKDKYLSYAAREFIHFTSSHMGQTLN